ncbi:AMP-binding protein [Frankia sp. Cppng1_Ct_nod]|uniref:AMP-binding protein n=1 Tax=Frankia sp. Cppng1_Ct_nod TaxID=2897162 RepID=UPI00104156F7|nr:AMP-binding protein [Frankia sp. Cppng1_Ct_nod]
MKAVQENLHAPGHQDKVLIERLAADGSVAETLTYAQVRKWSSQIRRVLAEHGLPAGTPVGLVADNGPGWVAADLALLLGGFVEVPVPLAFSGEQATSLLRETQVCLADPGGIRKLREWGLADAVAVIPVSSPHDWDAVRQSNRRDGHEPDIDATDDHIIKIIHTSGTTGIPKGVKIRSGALNTLVESLHAVSPAGVYDRYLSLVPFSLLIEQITAVYMPITSGGRMILLPKSTALLGTARSRAGDVLTWLRGPPALLPQCCPRPL